MLPNTLTLFVGDVTDELRIAAQMQDSSAYLINQTNIRDSHQGIAYVSIGDLLSIDDFFNLLCAANKIVYTAPRRWSDNSTADHPYSMGWITAHYIRLASTLHDIVVENLPENNNVVRPLTVRQTDQPQLWFAGCSTTYGIGINIDHRYQNIIKNTLALESTDLSCPGSSIAWARDQILNSDIKSKDIVVWGITTKDRFCWFDGATLTHVNIAYYSSCPEFDKVVSMSMLDSPHRLYEALSSIQQVNNFCNKIGAHLILANIHGNLEIAVECAKYKGFVMLHCSKGLDWDSSFLDFGTDNRHPGIKTHRYYAKAILEKIKNITQER